MSHPKRQHDNANGRSLPAKSKPVAGTKGRLSLTEFKRRQQAEIDAIKKFCGG